MGIDLIFNGVIDLPKSEYFFTIRVTFWQALVSFLSVLFLSIDTAIDDIIMRISHNIRQKYENIMTGFVGILCPQVMCA